MIFVLKLVKYSLEYIFSKVKASLTTMDNVELPDLCRKLRATREKTPNGSFFIPREQIEKFAEKSIIRSVIKESDVIDREKLAEVVSKHCRRIFLILILMNRLDWLEGLVALGLKDDSLPLQLDQDDDERMFGISTSGERFDFPSDAPIQDEGMFQTFQALLTAPVFEGDRKFGQLLQKSQPLPYLKFAIAGEKLAGKGFFSEVDKTRIHCAHLPEYPPVSTSHIPLHLIHRSDFIRAQVPIMSSLRSNVSRNQTKLGQKKTLQTPTLCSLQLTSLAI